MHNVKGHKNAVATETTQRPSFSSATYLEGLMAELDRAAICSRIHEARKRSGLTQEEAADALHVHRRTMQNWESPKLRIVPWDRVEDIARVLNVSRDWLLHGDEQPATGSEEAIRRVVREEMAVVLAAFARLEERLGGRTPPQGKP